MNQFQGFSEKCLVKNTTKEQRKKIVEEVRNITGNCGVSSGKKGMEYMQLYIDGERELKELFDMYIAEIQEGK